MNLSSGIAPIRKYIDKDMKIGLGSDISGGEFLGKVGSFEVGYEFDAVILDDSLLASPYELSIRQRVERAIYQSLDIYGIVDKYVKGRKIIFNDEVKK